MYSKIGVIFLSIFSIASAGILAVPTVQVLQGPGSKTTLLGPDGSALGSRSPGGTVVTSGAAGLVPAGPAVLASSPDIVVRGPAGSVLTSYTAAGPAVVPAVIASPAVAAAPTIALAPSLAGVPSFDGDDHSGDYVSENTELLYDDGSYRGE